nr:hypothetical protein [Glutamicibacter protophormiae]
MHLQGGAGGEGEFAVHADAVAVLGEADVPVGAGFLDAVGLGVAFELQGVVGDGFADLFWSHGFEHVRGAAEVGVEGGAAGGVDVLQRGEDGHDLGFGEFSEGEALGGEGGVFGEDAGVGKVGAVAVGVAFAGHGHGAGCAAGEVVGVGAVVFVGAEDFFFQLVGEHGFEVVVAGGQGGEFFDGGGAVGGAAALQDVGELGGQGGEHVGAFGVDRGYGRPVALLHCFVHVLIVRLFVEHVFEFGLSLSSGKAKDYPRIPEAGQLEPRPGTTMVPGPGI